MAFRFLLTALLFIFSLKGWAENQSTYPATQSKHLLKTKHSSNKVIPFSGPSTSFQIEAYGNGYVVTDLSGQQVPKNVAADARLRFSDVTIALDIDGLVGKTYRLYQAAFNRTPDANGLAFWIGKMDEGLDVVGMAQQFSQSTEFSNMYGYAPSNSRIINLLYRNILHREGDVGGIAYWLTEINSRRINVAQLLVSFSESHENKASVNSKFNKGIYFLENNVSYNSPFSHAGANFTSPRTHLITLDGSASRSHTMKALSYQWEIISKPSGSRATLIDANTFQPSFLPDELGNYEISLTVNDGVRASGVSKVTVTAIGEGATNLPQGKSYVYLKSGSGDSIGQGNSYTYTTGNAQFSLSSVENGLRIMIYGDQSWMATFTVPAGQKRLTAGNYSNIKKYTLENSTSNRMDFNGVGRNCNVVQGSFSIDKITYEVDKLTELDLRFEQYCDNNSAALQGRIHFIANEANPVVGPSTVLPANLWQPLASQVPKRGNYVYLESTAGDRIGGGEKYSFTQSNSQFFTKNEENGILFSVYADKLWNSNFLRYSVMPKLVQGYYGGLSRNSYSSIGPGVFWWTNDIYCSDTTGWFVVDSISYKNGDMTSFDARFEQQCVGDTGKLNGKIHWTSEDKTTRGPVLPFPDGLWQPQLANLPKEGNYAYLESEAGDPVGNGKTHVYHQNNAVISALGQGGDIRLTVNGDQEWVAGMVNFKDLYEFTPGYYDQIDGYPYVSFSSASFMIEESGFTGARCSSPTSGWFAIDKVNYVNYQLNELDMRFEQYCGGATSPMRGKIHWTASNAAKPALPTRPVPAGLWKPTISLPYGNYLYIDSEKAGPLFDRKKKVYNNANGLRTSAQYTSPIQFEVRTPEWGGFIKGLTAAGKLLPGYYGDLRPLGPNPNPMRGEMLWQIGSSCNQTTGWFVVDNIFYDSNYPDRLLALDFRFEQRCEGEEGVINGALHWTLDGENP